MWQNFFILQLLFQSCIFWPPGAKKVEFWLFLYTFWPLVAKIWSLGKNEWVFWFKWPWRMWQKIIILWILFLIFLIFGPIFNIFYTFKAFLRSSWLKREKMYKMKKFHLVHNCFKCGICSFLFLVCKCLKNSKKWKKSRKRHKSKVNLFTLCVCTWTHGLLRAHLICFGDKHYNMLKFWWSFDIIWPSHDPVKKVTDKQTNGQTNKRKNNCKIYIRIWTTPCLIVAIWG